MIVDLPRFVETERPYWRELEERLTELEKNPEERPSLDSAERLHYLYQRASASLAKVAHVSSEPEMRRYLETLVARAHGEIQESRERNLGWNPWRWFTRDFPQAFRRHAQAFGVTVGLTLLGVVFAVIAMTGDPESRHVFLPFGHADKTPKERVAEEQRLAGSNMSEGKTQFSAQLMTHNTRVSMFCMALGMTYAFGTIVLLFFNGAMLGAICYDYILDGQSVFLMGWLMPHGVIEIPAILVGGQAGLLIGHALIGWGSRTPLADRMRNSLPDIAHLMGGTAMMMVWAGLVEAFFSQYHEPVVPYAAKIAFGAVELAMLVTFLAFSGRKPA